MIFKGQKSEKNSLDTDPSVVHPRTQIRERGQLRANPQTNSDNLFVECTRFIIISLAHARTCWPTRPFFRSFLGSGPKGPMSCRTQGGISRRPSFRPSVRPPPLGHRGPQFCSLRPDFGPLSHQNRLNSPFRPQFSPRDLKSALQTSYLPSRPQISPPYP